MRDVDKLITEHQFEKAKHQLTEAKKLDPTNPFILAFEERIALFEGKVSPLAQPAPLSTQVHPAPDAVVSEKPAEEGQIAVSVSEQKTREQVEAEYKAKFTQELRKAEEQAAKVLGKEIAKLEQQKQELKSKYEHQLAETRTTLEHEFGQKLEGEIAKAEQRLKEKYQSEVASAEKDVKSTLAEQYEAKVRQLQEQLKEQEAALVERERRSFQEREQKIKQEFQEQLLEGLRKTEKVFQEQSIQQQKIEQERLKQQLTTEFQATLNKERGANKQRYENEKAALQQSFSAEKDRLKTESEQHIAREIEAVRRQQVEEFEHKRKILRKELEAEFQKKHEDQLAAERNRIQREADSAIEAEKSRLQEQHKTLIKAESEKVGRIRVELQKEMEQKLIARLERLSQEYDHKMELLGARVPESRTERTTMYRERLRECYANGQPTVEDARKIMELKEVLELSFDEHLDIEADVRLDLYVENVKRKIMTGELDTSDQEALEKLKQKYRISAEEAENLEPYILSCFQKLTTRGRILLVDDEELLLKAVEPWLTEAGFLVICALDIESALELLEKNAVDLIVSDIKFGDREFDGFEFFKAVQARPHWRSIPFVFMSSLSDGVIIRSGVQLGVDDYLTKPIEPELLIAVIEGKLKRYRNFSQN